MQSWERRVRNSLLASIVILLVFSFSSFAEPGRNIQKNPSQLEQLGSRFSFIVIGDNRTGDAIYRKVVAMAMARKPAFMVNTGDMIEKPGDRSQWASFRQMSQPITVPYFLTVGNHDAHPEVPGSEEVYREEVNLPGNELYYSFVAGNSLFVVLDSFIKGQEKKITGEQRSWLESVLAASKQQHKFIFVHHPLFTESNKGKHQGNSLDRFQDDRDSLQALFVKYKVTMVFAGHEHLYLRKIVNGIPHVIAGGAGAPLYAGEDSGGFHHFIQVHVNGDKVTAEAVDLNGRVRDRF